MARVTSYSQIKDGSLVQSFKRVDAAWGKYLKLLDKIANGTDKWKYYPGQLLNPEIQKKLFAEVIKESGLENMLEPDGRLVANPSPDDTFAEGDLVWTAGEIGHIDAFLASDERK